MIDITRQIRKLLRIVKTVIAARGLEVLLLGKQVTMPDGGSLGAVTAIKKELSQDKIWMVINNLGHKRIIPIEQVANVAHEVVLFDDLPLASLAADGDTSRC